MISSPTIEITPCVGEMYFPPPSTPHRPSLDVVFTMPAASAQEEEFQIDPSLNLDTDDADSSFRQRSYTAGSKGSQSGSKRRIGSLKNLLKDMSPNFSRRRRRSHHTIQSNAQPDLSDQETTDLTTSKSKSFRPKLSLSSKYKSFDDESYFSENDKYSRRFRGKRHSLDNILMGAELKLAPEPAKKSSMSIMSSMKNLFSLSKSESSTAIGKQDSLKPHRNSAHRRMVSDSDLIDLTREQEDRTRRRSTMDNTKSPALRRVSKAHKNQKLTILIDTKENKTSSSNSQEEEAGADSLISVLLVMIDANENLDFEVSQESCFWVHLNMDLGAIVSP